jgi:hypothetical protein
MTTLHDNYLMLVAFKGKLDDLMGTAQGAKWRRRKCVLFYWRLGRELVP